MGLKDILKNAGLVTDDPATPSTDVAPATTPHVVRPYTGISTPVSSPSIFIPPIGEPNVTAMVDKDIVATLMDSISKSRNTGYDSFKVIFDTMNGIPDPTRYPMSLELNKNTHNVPYSAVVDSIDEKLSILDGESKNFEDALQAQIQTEVTARQTRMQQMADQIAQFTKEISDLQAQQVTLSSEITEKQGALTTDHANFTASLNVIKNGLAAERERINTIIKQATLNV